MSKEYIFAKHNRSIEKRATKKRKPAETVQQTKCIKKTQQNSNTHICPKKNSNSAKKRRQKANNQDFVLYRPKHKRDQPARTENTQKRPNCHSRKHGRKQTTKKQHTQNRREKQKQKEKQSKKAESKTKKKCG